MDLKDKSKDKKDVSSVENKLSSLSSHHCVWEDLNPLLSNVFAKIKSWLNRDGEKNNSLCLFQIVNAAEIIFAYGDKAESFLKQKLEDTIKSCFKDFEVEYTRIGVQDFIFLIKGIKPEKLHSFILGCSSKMRSQGLKFAKHPMYVDFQVGSTYIKKGDSVAAKFGECLVSLGEAIKSKNKVHLNFNEIEEAKSRVKAEMKMAADLQEAMESDMLALAYQHVVCAKTGKLKSYEVLLRLKAPNGELISAGKYIKVAEDYGFITEIDLYVLKLACSELKKSPEIKLGINVSADSIESEDWLARAKEYLKDASVAQRLIVEITETSYQNDISKLVHFVEEIQSLGCEIAIDDFGAGYTSFSQLKLINADILKIDGIFISDILENPDSKLFVRTMLEFSKAFGLKTVAEFVENGEIAKLLIEMGVDYLQGHYFGKPLNYRPWIKDDAIA